MAQQIQIIGLSVEEVRQLIKGVLMECLIEIKGSAKEQREKTMNIAEACKFLKISRPTLQKYVEKSLLRRHDLGRKKKLFYLSELEEDIKKINAFSTKAG